ncbi:MAG: adenylate/guanylate cyclase domain-containing protein [Bacteroidota bacterium]
MESTRKLAAIMFTDIQGYTALMQEDEAQALQMRNRHREVFQRLHKEYNGTILQYYGDGTLSVFDSAIDAAQCGVQMQKELQEEPKVPLRIGIHTGDILYSETEAIGDGVNVASRVESVAVPGSVMISEKVYDYIKNQKEIPVQSMGRFNFKNVEKPLEVYALGLEGLVVPNPDSLSGKFTKHNSKQKPESKASSSRPKWLLPLIIGGLILGVTAIWALGGFGGESNENSAYASIKVKDENGNVIEKKVVSSSVQKKILLVDFNHENEADSLEWLEVAVPFALEMEWDQDGYMLTAYQEDKKFEVFNEELEEAEERRLDYVMRGSISSTDSTFTIKPELFSVSTGQQVQSWSFSGAELLPLLDEASLQIKKDLGVPEEHLSGVKDLPLTQQLSENIEAVEKMIIGVSNFGKDLGKVFKQLKEAEEDDESFAMASYLHAMLHHQLSFSREQAVNSIANAMKHRKRLSETMETNIRMLNYRIQGEPEKAVQLAKMMADLRPAQADLQSSLANEYRMLGQWENALESVKRYQIARDDPNAMIEFELHNYFVLGRLEEGIKKGEAFVKANPEKLEGIKQLGKLYLKAGEYGKAKPLFEKATLLDPESPYWDRFLDHISFMEDSASFMTEAYLSKLLGDYEVEFRKLSIGIEADPPFLKMNILNQPDYPLFPTSRNLFFTETQELEIKYPTELEDEAEFLWLKENTSGYLRCFKEDENIQEAHKLLADKNYTEALSKYKAATETHPEHYYLKNYIQHIEFMQKKGDKWNEDFRERFLGTYTSKNTQVKGTLTEKEGELYFQLPNFPGTMEASVILPMSETEFMLPSSLISVFDFKKRGKKIKSISLILGGQKRGTLVKDK